MSNFEFYLQDIASNVSSPNDSDDYDDFFAIKNYVINIMRKQDSYFDSVCKKDIRFGSTAHDIRLYDDEEFDVLLELEFPAYSQIVQRADKHRPGFVTLDFSNALCGDMVTNKLANNQRSLLSRSSLKNWLESVFLNALDNFGDVVYMAHADYSLEYKYRGITYTIYAAGQTRTFSIDFVPAVKIVRPHSNTWHAIPKFKAGPGNTTNYTFMISNAQAELHHVKRCGQTLKDALRLLQALRNSKELPKLRCYHMVTVAIWLARRIGHFTVCHMSVSDVFLMLLSDLCDAFVEGHLSYVWDSQMNLLSDFSPKDMSLYTNILCSAYNKLKSYPYQSTLSFRRCLSHFQ